jgi:hypothetical protein
MSDNWIVLVPQDPSFIPETAKQLRARDRFAEIAPHAHQIEIKVCDTIRFFDSGGNFERVVCPSCGAEIPIFDWWRDRMDEDYDGGFKLASYVTPCCGIAKTLHQLVYEWPATFGRFALSAMNPNIGLLDDKYKRELEEILETKLTVIYQHI